LLKLYTIIPEYTTFTLCFNCSHYPSSPRSKWHRGCQCHRGLDS